MFTANFVHVYRKKKNVLWHWARRLEWVIDELRDLADADMDLLQTDFEQVLRQSREVHFWNYDQHRVAELKELLEKVQRACCGFKP